MIAAAAAILIIVWPGHQIPDTSYQSVAQCEQTLDLLRRAGHDMIAQIPGFRASCEQPAGPPLVS